MFAKVERLLVGNHKAVRCDVVAVKVFHHGKSFRIANHRCLRINLQKLFDACRVIRFHMLHDKVIGFTFADSRRNVCQPLVCEMPIHSVHHSDFVAGNDVTVVRHAVWHAVLSFKQIYFVVVYTYINIWHTFSFLKILLMFIVLHFSILHSRRAPHQDGTGSNHSA